MSKIVPVDIVEHFSSLPDPRVHIKKNEHKLIDIIVTAICAVICGADNWHEISQYGIAKQDWLKTFLHLPNGIPSHDTFNRIFHLLRPEEFQRCFSSWIRAAMKMTKGQVVAIDGKRLRSSYDKKSNKSAIHMVSAQASANRVVLGQVKTEEKSNEIKAMPELLKILDIAGCIVTVDAAGCQKKIIEDIIDKGGDYVAAVKGNQPNLFKSVSSFFKKAEMEQLNGSDFDFFSSETEGHGRHEFRCCFSTENIGGIKDISQWKGARSISAVISSVTRNGKVTESCRYYISSLNNNAKTLAESVRAHWGIENSVHWVLDTAFREDDSRLRKGHSAENFSVLRHIALNLLKQEKTELSVKSKRLKAGWDNAFLGKILAGL
jgi:predicted transposase YbfD/YdcC